jgi:hypothetical protein
MASTVRGVKNFVEEHAGGRQRVKKGGRETFEYDKVYMQSSIPKIEGESKADGVCGLQVGESDILRALV